MSARIDAEAGNGPWRRLQGAATLDVLLFARGTDVPPDIALMRKVFELAQALGNLSRLQVRTVLGGQAQACGTPDVLVLWEPPAGTAAEGGTQAALGAMVDRAAHTCFVGDAVLWLLRSRRADGRRVALHWHHAATEDAGGRAILSPSIIEHAGSWSSCCGGTAAIDLALGLVRDVLGTQLAGAVQDRLCIERIREPGERQRAAMPARFAAQSPTLAEAIALMEANIEEPLQAEEIASLTGISRRQLERLFKQHLNAAPARHYLEIRLAHARRLLRESHHSLLQIGLMCGFSSGPHFSTAYRTVFGLTPREERQRLLPPGA